MKAYLVSLAILAVPAMAVADEQTFDWQGAYAGVTLGGASGNFELPSFVYGPFFDPLRSRATGALGGLHAGWNMQAGVFVLGVEADALLSRVVGEEAGTIDDGWDLLDYRYGSSVDWLSTVRARAGIASGRTLLFATGGLAIGSVRDFTIMTLHGYGTQSATTRSTEIGWSAGAGIEHAVTDRVSLRVDYLFVDLGDRVLCGCASSPLLPTYDMSFHTLRLGVSYRF